MSRQKTEFEKLIEAFHFEYYKLVKKLPIDNVADSEQQKAWKFMTKHLQII